MTYAIKAQSVDKKFKLYTSGMEKLKDLIFFNREGRQHTALSEVTFTIPKGEVVGILGVNGSGKSTLSNLIAGVSLPTKGDIEVNGSAALISIGAGLNNQLTGLENIELKGLMLGLTKKQINELTPSIIEFAEIGKFIDQPLKTYSSGMKSRLGFAISVHIEPDILIIDEALSVGDASFADKCLKKINEFKEKGRTIIFISHSLGQVRNFCQKAMWIHKGILVDYGDVNPIADEYAKFINDFKTAKSSEKIREVELKYDIDVKES